MPEELRPDGDGKVTVWRHTETLTVAALAAERDRLAEIAAIPAGVRDRIIALSRHADPRQDLGTYLGEQIVRLDERIAKVTAALEAEKP